MDEYIIWPKESLDAQERLSFGGQIEAIVKDNRVEATASQFLGNIRFWVVKRPTVSELDSLKRLCESEGVSVSSTIR